MADPKTPEAGPQLDLEIAQAVFGLTAGPCAGELEVTDGGLVCLRCAYAQGWEKRDDEKHDFKPKPYSASMTSAWKIVEKVGLGIRPVIVDGEAWQSTTSDGVFHGFHPATAWEVSHMVERDLVFAVHKSPAMAICLGALEALKYLKEHP